MVVPPSRPRGPLKVLYVDNDSVVLSWIEPDDDGGAEVSCYIVQAREIRDGDSIVQHRRFDASTTTHLMGPLQTGRIYQFRVSAENEAGISDTLVNKTPVRIKANIVKPDAPGKPCMLEESAEGITLSWHPSINDGGSPVTNYVIERRDILSEHWVLVNRTNVTDTQYHLGSLVPGLEYEFRVSAENIAGFGPHSPKSDPIAIKHREVLQAPTFIEEFQDLVVLEGQKATFEVKAIGTPIPEITWYQNGVEMWDGRKNGIKTEGTNSILTFPSVSAESEGVIECEGENKAGMAICSARLIVEAPPKMTIPSHYHDGLLYDGGETAKIKITVTGKPPPFVTWVFNDRLLEGSPRHSMDYCNGKLTLTITDLGKRDSGVYCLAAVNRHGQDTASFHLTVNDVPDPPRHLVVGEMGYRRVQLDWREPETDGGSRISSFHIFQSENDANDWFRVQTVRHPSAVIENLIPGHHYNFSVTAENLYGSSEKSEPVRILISLDNE